MHRTDLEQGEKWTPVDMLAYVSCTTLDIMGLAGFNYSFNSVQQLSEGLDMTDNLSSAARELLLLAEALSLLAFFKMFFPIFRLITWDARSKIMDRGEAAMREIGRKLVDEKRRALNSSYEKEQAKDLLTLLIKANMNEGGRDDRSMSDDEVMNQIPTFLMAGAYNYHIFTFRMPNLSHHRSRDYFNVDNLGTLFSCDPSRNPRQAA